MTITSGKLALDRERSSLLTWVKRNEILILILISSIVFVGLGQSSLKDYDEGIYSQVAREMLLKNDWVTLHFGGEPWFEKPPVYIWTTALLFKTFGVNEFWARAASAFSGVVVILLTYMVGSNVFGRRVGFLSVVPLMTGYEFLRQSRNGTTDVMLTMFMMAALAAYIVNFKKRDAAWYALAVALALGFMVKFWAALIIMLTIAISLVIEGKVRETFSNKHFWGAVLLALLLIVPWHITMYALHGQAFLDRYVLYDLLKRSATQLEGNAGTTRFYFDSMSYDYSPWFFLLPIALTLELKRLFHHRDRSSVLFIFAACLFGVYSLLVSTKIIHYLTPIYPVFAIFIANSIIKAYDDNQSFAYSGLVIAALVAMLLPSRKVFALFLVLCALLVAALLLVRFVTSHIKNSARENEKRPNVIYRFFIWLGTFGEKNNLPKIAVIVMCVFLAIPGILRNRPLYKVEESAVEQIAKVAGASVTIRDETIIALALPPDYENAIVGPAAMFYSNRPIEVAWSDEELKNFTSDGPREIMMGESFIDVLKDEYDFMILAHRTPFVYGVIQQRGD